MIRIVPYQCVVIGVSAGGLNFLKELLSELPEDFTMPLVAVQHLSDASTDMWAEILNAMTRLKVKEADEKEAILPGFVYVAPANYHLMIEKDRTLSLTIDEKVNYARPSIDVLFESAAPVYHEALIGIVGTGANHDGARGLLEIKRAGGVTVVQDPDSAEVKVMPRMAIDLADPHLVLSASLIRRYLLEVHENNLLTLEQESDFLRRQNS